MTADADRRHAQATLRLLLQDGAPADWATTDWRAFTRLASRNVVTVRAFRRLEALGLRPGPPLAQAAAQEQARIAGTVALIGRLTECCRVARVGFVFTKAFQHWPDMGHDVDLLIEERSPRVDRLIEEALDIRPTESSLLNRVSGKVPYDSPGLASPIELHHGLIGQIGEHRDYVREVIGRRVQGTWDGITTWQPGVEDQLIIQSIQRVYGHFFIRIGDVVASDRLCRTPGISWDDVAETSRRIGVRKGLSSYLASVRDIQRDALGDVEALPAPARALAAAPSTLVFRRGVYRVRLVGQALPAYASKWTAECRSRHWATAARLGLLPVFAAWGLTRWTARRALAYSTGNRREG